MLVVAGLVTVMVWQEMVRLYVVPVPVQPFESVAVTTIGNVPTWVGVPASVPSVCRTRPAGSVLAVENVVVPTPPVCVNICENGVPAVPVFTPGLFTVMVWQ